MCSLTHPSKCNYLRLTIAFFTRFFFTYNGTKKIITQQIHISYLFRILPDLTPPPLSPLPFLSSAYSLSSAPSASPFSLNSYILSSIQSFSSTAFSFPYLFSLISFSPLISPPAQSSSSSSFTFSSLSRFLPSLPFLHLSCVFLLLILLLFLLRSRRGRVGEVKRQTGACYLQSGLVCIENE